MNNQSHRPKPLRVSSILRPPSSIAENVRRAALALEAAHIDSPRLSAEVLLAHVLHLTRTQILTRLEQNIPSEALAHFDRLVERATKAEPVAYLVGHREFYGLDFVTDARALVPRPETELLVDLALRALAENAAVVDVGTGSGCIAVAMATRAPTAHLTALDISPEALALAQRNAERHQVAERITFARSDLLSGVAGPFNVICANLPYVPTAEVDRLPFARHEPRLALDGGADGLALIRRLLIEARSKLAPHGRLLLEIGHAQSAAVFALSGAFFSAAERIVHRDLANIERVVEIRT